MAEPPSYEESTSGAGNPSDHKGDSKTHQQWSIREQVGLSRTHHVASIVSQIVEHIRERATQGLSKTTLVFIPSDQDASRKGTIVGFPDGEVPTMIQFEGRHNSMQFWQQEEALSELRAQLWHAVTDGVPVESTPVYLEERPLPAPKKPSWFGRKSSKAPEILPRVQQSNVSPVTVEVRLEDVHFRSENEFGLYETLSARVVMAMVDVR